MLPDTPPVLALMVIQRLHEHLRDPASWARCREAQVTFSAGLAVHEPTEEFEETLERADRALYEAKRGGRDRCVEAAPASASTRQMQLTLLGQD
jgi:PleD family two-component response regulator